MKKITKITFVFVSFLAFAGTAFGQQPFVRKGTPLDSLLSFEVSDSVCFHNDSAWHYGATVNNSQKSARTILEQLRAMRICGADSLRYMDITVFFTKKIIYHSISRETLQENLAEAIRDGLAAIQHYRSFAAK
jgi:hypothetical protein